MRGATRRRHAARGLHVVQNPHHFLHVGPHLTCDTRLPCRYTRKNSPSTPSPPLTREKTRPAQGILGPTRYKTHPARPKWLISARFARVWRTLYLCRQQETTQGELSTACEAETGLTNTTAHQAPLLWRAPEGPGGLSITGPGCGGRGRRGLAAVPVGGGAWPRCRWVAAGPGRASRSTTPSLQARVWRSRGRAAAHRHAQQPGPQAAQERCVA